MTKDIPKSSTEHIYQKIKDLLIQSRSRAFQAVNTQMVVCYWNIGRLIVEEEQHGEKRAGYGKHMAHELSKRLTREFGKGFHKRNLWFMRNFYMAYPKVNALRSELSWTHYRLLLRVEDSTARTFYEAEAINTRWSTRQLERQIASLLFDRLALSRDKNGVSDAVVRYTLPEDNNQIFASRYKLYLPTEEELAAEIQKERRFIEMEKRLSDKEETGLNNERIS